MQPSVEQLLCSLKQVLHTLGQTDAVDHHILYPGHRREQLIRGLVGRILGGKSIDHLQLGGSALELLAGDERFAERCRLLLQMLNITATAEQIRGCSGQQEQDTALVLRIAQLLQAMQQRRGSSSQGAAAASSLQEAAAAAGPPDGAVAQLLTNACSNLAKLTSDSMQLFAADMSEVLKTYSDQGALQQLQQLRQQTTAKAQQLQEQLQQALASGSSCEGACSEAWRQQVQQVEQGVDLLLQQVQQFDQTYQQELSVWADVANGEEQQQQLVLGLVLQAAGSSDSVSQVAEGVGLAARRMVAAYKGVNAALEGFGCIMKQHQALQNVPAAVLQEQRAVHAEEARMYSSSAAILQSAAAGAQ